MIVGVTPARGGSQGIPRKNLVPLCGKPLLAWTIEAAAASRLVDRYVVSTEDPEIARVAGQLGAEVLDRPAELASDDATTLAVLQDVVAKIPADVVVLLQATSPIRDADLIDRCIARFLETGADSLATGFWCTYTEYGTPANALPRQQVKGFFYDDGNVYVMKAELIRAGQKYGQRIERMLTDREQQIDIDEEFDVWLAEQVLTRRLARHSRPAASPAGLKP